MQHAVDEGIERTFVMNQLELLLALQAIDEEITACEEEKKRLPVRRTISDLASEIKTLQENNS